MMEQEAFSIVDAGRTAGIGRSTLYQEIAAGRLRAVKRGRRTLILAADLRRWLAALPALHKTGSEFE